MPDKDEVSIDTAALEQLPRSTDSDAPAHLLDPPIMTEAGCDFTCGASCWTKTCRKTCGITG